MAARKQADRHYRSPQVPVGARLDPDDFDALETRRKTLGMNRRQAIIAAIREWAGKPARTETTKTPQEQKP
jgi:hypothetical protein